MYHFSAAAFLKICTSLSFQFFKAADVCYLHLSILCSQPTLHIHFTSSSHPAHSVSHRLHVVDSYYSLQCPSLNISILLQHYATSMSNSNSQSDRYVSCCFKKRGCHTDRKAAGGRCFSHPSERFLLLTQRRFNSTCAAQWKMCLVKVFGVICKLWRIDFCGCWQECLEQERLTICYYLIFF